MQQISLSQRATKDELKGDIDGLKVDMETNMDGMEAKIDMRNFDGEDLITWILQMEKVPVQTILSELDEEGKIILEPEAVTEAMI